MPSAHVHPVTSHIFQYVFFGDHLFEDLSACYSVVGIATGYGLYDYGVGFQVPLGSTISSSPRRPDRLWGSPNLLANGYRGLFPRGSSGRAVKLATHLQLVPRSRKYGSIHPLLHTPSWRSAYLFKYRDNFTLSAYFPRQCALFVTLADGMAKFRIISTFVLFHSYRSSFARGNSHPLFQPPFIPTHSLQQSHRIHQDGQP
jgi:hypothetical protein